MAKDLGAVASPVTTDRLVLRRARTEDVEAIGGYRAHPTSTEWLGPLPEDFTQRFVAPERLGLLIAVERDGDLIGDVMVSIGDAWAPVAMATQGHGVQAELGWALRPEATGHGYATEALEAVLRICFEDLALRRVTATCFAANTASWRVMDRLGMRRESHTVADSLHPSGEWRDGYTYALLADEWRGRDA